MSQLNSITLDIREAERELKAFEAFIQANEFFRERDVVRVLKECPHLCCLLGFMIYRMPPANAYKFEFGIQGLFAADLVVGNSDSCQFMLVEFEGGEENSLFGGQQSRVKTRYWSRQLESGFGQLVDWGWAIDDARHNVAFKSAFGCERIAAQFLLVCGRYKGMRDMAERDRLFWRAHNVFVSRRLAACLTYDELLDFFRAQIAIIKSCAPFAAATAEQ